MDNLNESEKDFIEGILGGKEDIVTSEDDKGLIIKKTNKPKKKKTPAYKKPSSWAAAFFILPFLFTGSLFFILGRLQSLVGGKESLDWFVENGVDSNIDELLSSAGFEWFPQFVEVYQNRGLIIAGAFTVCILIVVALVIYDINKSREEEENDEEDFEK